MLPIHQTKLDVYAHIADLQNGGDKQSIMRLPITGSHHGAPDNVGFNDADPRPFAARQGDPKSDTVTWQLFNKGHVES